MTERDVKRYHNRGSEEETRIDNLGHRRDANGICVACNACDDTGCCGWGEKVCKYPPSDWMLIAASKDGQELVHPNHQ